jgi:hypothetical protein
MSLLNDIKNSINKSGSSKKKFIYFKKGTKLRLRFLTDLEDGIKIKWHAHWDRKIGAPCQEHFGRECPYCGDEEIAEREMFAWPVYCYEANEVQILLFAANNASPIPAIVGMYEAYGNITDRDYVITQNGEQTSKTFQVVPMDKAKFKSTGKNAVMLSEQKILKEIDKAYPVKLEEEDEDDVPKKKKAKKPVEDDDDEDDYTPPKKAKKKPEPEPEEDEDDDDEEIDYEELDGKELYQLCKKRGIAAEIKKPDSYYIKKLEKWDAEREDDDEDGDEPW